MSHDDLMQRLREHLATEGLKFTQQRRVIAEVVFDSDAHLTLNDILDRARALHASVGYATVYRTMKLLTDSGLAEEHRFSDGQTRYERADADHHDHIICRQCGRIVEFESEEIERIQDGIAHQLGFQPVSHKHEIYANCTTTDCRWLAEAASPQAGSVDPDNLTA